jgi:hypothetical protein
VKKLLKGLKSSKKGKAKRMQSPLTGIYKVSTSAEGDAEAFAEHFGPLYGREPEYDMAVLEKIKQREVRLDLDGEPTAAEIAAAVKALKISAALGARVWVLRSGRRCCRTTRRRLGWRSTCCASGAARCNRERVGGWGA